tara:strand:+ start:165 stop:608 length:444 start_codon:yes stop_codon:yes gene_type:complete
MRIKVIGWIVLNYTSDVTSLAAWEALTNDKNAFLIDVRTNAEWSFVGVPDLSSLGKDLICVQWQTFPKNDLNVNFLDEVKNYVNIKNNLYFLCRSGSRSRSAAICMAKEGFNFCYNVSDGFEGSINISQQRNKVDGWKFCGLPWVQS